MDGGTSGVAYALKHSTLEGRITMGALVVFSLISWTVILNKFRQIRKARKKTEEFLTAYSEGDSPLDVITKGAVEDDPLLFDGSPLFDVYIAACNEIKKQVAKHGKRISSHGMNAVRVSLERGMGEANVTLESGMIILATAISGGPFVGLLGTVWGVMDTFASIAQMQQASLTAMAPGVAAALINTVIGLLVAIPSLFCYNYLVTKIREMSIEIDNFAAHLDNVFSSEYLQNGKNGTPTVGQHAAELESAQQEAYPTTGSPHPGIV
jgi:biopolymer transport protein ExbB/TolQ